MTDKPLSALIAVDVGNSAIKLCRFDLAAAREPLAQHLARQLSGPAVAVVDQGTMCSPDKSERSAKPLDAWLAALPAPAQDWYVASVNGPLQTALASRLQTHRPQDRYVVLRHHHFPLHVDVRSPDSVGADRLAAAVAVNALRSPTRPAIVIDAGTAITIDAVASDGAFLGGAIFPGLETAAAALANATDALPRIRPRELTSPPPCIGKSTVEALYGGVVWGSVGAIREHVTRMTAELSSTPEVYCTGRAGGYLTDCLGQQFTFDPNLVLRGIALTGLHQEAATDNDQAD